MRSVRGERRGWCNGGFMFFGDRPQKSDMRIGTREKGRVSLTPLMTIGIPF